MKLYVKNMVCDRCKLVVKQVFEKAHQPVQSIQLGEVELSGEVSSDNLNKIEADLKLLGFELIDDKRSRLIEQIKMSILHFVRHLEAESNTKLSAHLAAQLHYDYTYLSNLFSEVEGKTIEQFHIAQRIEWAKELLVYDELNLNEIALKLGYKSVAHLSSQFKKVTGLTPTHFKQVKENRRTPLDRL